MKTIGAVWVLAAGALLAQAPATSYAAADAGYSAVCKDGSSWNGASKRGACHGHKGVQSWSSEGGSTTTASSANATTESSSSSKRSRKSKSSEAAASVPAASATASAGGAYSASCKDGSSWSGASKRGACRGHKGVQTWSSEGGAAAPAAASNNTAAQQTAPVASARASNSTAATASRAQAPGGGPGMVWVNSSSKVYHCPNDRWYGKTREGSYMTEAQAKSQGYRADRGKACTQ